MTTEDQKAELTIGQFIRQKREEKNLSLKVISQRTKIHVGLLELLEKDELAQLPSKIYVRGFVKSTAQVLGLDTKEALALLDKGYKEKAPPEKINKPDDYLPKESLDYFKSLKNSALTSSSLLAKILIGFIFIAILGINIKSYLEKPTEETKQKLPPVLTTVHQKTKPAPKSIAVKVKPQEEDANLSTQAMPINLIQDKKDNKPPEIKPPKITKPEMKEIVVKMSKEELDKYIPPKYQFLPPKGIEHVFLNAADGDSWITYKVGNAEIKKYVLRQGRTVFLHGEVIRLFLGNTKTIKVFHNKNLVTFKDKAGTKNLVYPESLKETYPDPLFVFEKDGTVHTNTP